MSIGNTIREIIRVSNIDRLLRLFSKDKWVGSTIGKLVPENWQYKPGTVRRATRNGLSYLLDISDYQQWLIYFGFLNDRPDGLHGLVKPGFNIIDVGGNIGQTSMELSGMVSHNGRIWAFEPDPLNYSKFKTHLELNDLPNIEAINKGLGSHEHQARMMPKTEHNRGGSNVQLEDHGQGVQVEITTLDRFVADRGIRANLIKIDVEGYEMEVLKGAEGTLRSQRPILFVEVDDELLRAKGTSPSAVIAFVEALGYNILKAGSHERLTKDQDFSGCHFDICAMPNQAAG